MIPPLNRYHVVTQLQSGSWEVREKQPGEPPNADDLVLAEAVASTLAELEMELRRAMWHGHGHSGRYGDDGEMQCWRCRPYGAVDYKRAPLDAVRGAYGLALLEAVHVPSRE